MKKIIISVMCLMLFATNISAEQKEKSVKYGDVELTCVSDDVHNEFFGLSKNGRTLLPVRYGCVYNEEVGLLVFFADRDLYLYDMKGKKIAHEQLDFPVDKDASVEFEPVKERADVPCFELRAYYFNNSWGAQTFGTFYSKGGHIYRIKRPKPEMMN
ncbi:MAG: hypothetical protein IKR92_03485 [Alphaproteobacteria bacterium]|nr:hypothetical protein [Alphaproteobacteria bacterium]